MFFFNQRKAFLEKKGVDIKDGDNDDENNDEDNFMVLDSVGSADEDEAEEPPADTTGINDTEDKPKTAKKKKLPKVVGKSEGFPFFDNALVLKINTFDNFDLIWFQEPNLSNEYRYIIVSCVDFVYHIIRTRTRKIYYWSIAEDDSIWNDIPSKSLEKVKKMQLN